MNTRISYIDDTDALGKREILKAALMLFVEGGIDSTSVRDIGAKAGLTNPALFKHFSSKEGLALYLFERIFRHFRATLPLIGPSPFESQLRCTLAAYLVFFDQDMIAALYFQENLRRLWPLLPADLRSQSLIAHFHSLLQVGGEQKVVSTEDDPRLQIALVSGFLGQFARQLYFQEIQGPATTRLEEIHKIILRGLAPRLALQRAAKPRPGKNTATCDSTQKRGSK